MEQTNEQFYKLAQHDNIFLSDPKGLTYDYFSRQPDWKKKTKILYAPCREGKHIQYIRLGNGFPLETEGSYCLLFINLRIKAKKYLRSEKLLVNIYNYAEIIKFKNPDNREHRKLIKRRDKSIESLIKYNRNHNKEVPALLRYVLENNGTATLDDLHRVSGISDTPMLISKIEQFGIVGKRGIDGVIRYGKCNP